MWKPDNRLYSGFVAGAVSSVVVWPLNVIQVQRQISGHLSRSGSSTNTVPGIIRNIYQKQNISGFYRGVSKGVWAYSVFYGSFFYTNDFLKRHSPEGAVYTLLRSYAAAAVGSILSNPHHVVRIRCQSGILKPTYTSTSTSISIRQIYKNEGFQALTKGLGPTLVKNWELSIIMFLHEYLSEQYLLPAYLSSGIGKLAATSITYPIDSYRTARRFDSGLTSREILTTFRETPSKVYWGYWAYVVRSIPATVIAFHVRSMFTKI